MQHPTDSKTNHYCRLGMLFIAFLAPWPHGGELYWEYLPFTSLILTLLAIAIQKNKKQFTDILNQYKYPLTLLGLWLLYGFLQATPLPKIFVAFVNPNAAVYYESNLASLSISPGLSLLDTLKNISYAASLLLCLLLFQSKHHIWLLAKVMFFSSAMMAFYSLINHYSAGAFSIVESIPPWTITWEKVAHGTFSYQNHYASFLTLTIPLGGSLLYKDICKTFPKDRPSRPTEFISNLLLSPAILYLLCIFVMFLALISTSSRGGNLVFLASLLFAALIFARFNKASPHKTQLLAFIATSAFLIAIILVLLFSGAASKLGNRYIEQGLDPHGRDFMRDTAFQIISDFPLTGSGAGTYPAIQHKYKGPELGNSERPMHAHNDYLEQIINQGAVGFILLVGTMLAFMGRSLAKLNQVRGTQRILKICCFTGIFAISVHSTMDFNFQLPVNSLYFYIMLSIALPCSQNLIKGTVGK